MNDTGERLRKARELLGKSRDEFAGRLETITSNKLYDLETGRAKFTMRILNELSYTFGLSYRWLEKGEGEMMMDAQHLKNLEAQMYARGIVSKEEHAIIQWLRSIGIDTLDKLRAILDPIAIGDSVASAVRERLEKYESKKK
jgi:transcriptional regulator with XRE-family HTH domain